MAVVVFLQVIFRYVLNLPLFWTEELARYCLVWASLLGSAVAVKRGQHIAVTIFMERLPPGAAPGADNYGPDIGGCHFNNYFMGWHPACGHHPRPDQSCFARIDVRSVFSRAGRSRPHVTAYDCMHF